MYVKDVTNMSLFAHRCKCGEMNVHGFWDQLDKTMEKEKHRVIVRMPCSKCDLVYTRAHRLTTGKSRPRMVDWSLLGLRILSYLWFLPIPLRNKFVSLLIFLEIKLPL